MIITNRMIPQNKTVIEYNSASVLNLFEGIFNGGFNGNIVCLKSIFLHLQDK